MSKKQNIDEIFNILGIKPKNKKLYYIALTHKTYTNENKKFQSYERLEFLGDSILQHYVSLYIYNHFNDETEGTMSAIRSRNISTVALARIIKKYKINKFIICSNNIDDLQNNEKICSDIFESLLAAIYLDLGQNEVINFLEKFLLANVHETSTEDVELKDPKTYLQELLQPIFKKPVQYDCVYDEKLNVWEAKAICQKIIYGIGTGKTKKEAEISAAKDALKKLK